MNSIIRMPALFGLAASLFACTSTSSNVVVGQGLNGIDYATAETKLEDAAGQQVTVQLVRYVSDNETGETSLERSEVTAFLSNLGIGEDGTSGTLTFNGEELTFTNDMAVLGNGQTAYLSPSDVGKYVASFSVHSLILPDTPGPGINTEGRFVIGFETNPTALTDTLHDSGSAEYVGRHFGYGAHLDGHGNLLYYDEVIEGSVTLNVSFVNNEVGGFISIDDFFKTNGATNFGFAEGDLVGNSFEVGTSDTTACPNQSSCSTDIQLIGALYGPKAEEAGGVIFIDYSETDSTGESLQVIGTTAFVLPLTER